MVWPSMGTHPLANCNRELHGEFTNWPPALPSKTALCRYVSKASATFGKTAGERQYMFINGRPVDLPKVEAVRTAAIHKQALAPAVKSA